MRISSGLRDAGLVLLTLVVVAGSVAVLRGYTLVETAANAVPQEAPPLRALAVVDDLAGPAGVEPGGSAIEQAAEALGWQLTLVPARGVGYTAAPAGESNLAGIVEQSLPTGPYDVVVLQAGAPDVDATAGEIGAGALGTLRRIRERVGASTRLVLAGPIRGTEEAQELSRVREVLETVATRERVLFLDPIEEDWFTGDAEVSDPLSQRELGRRLAAEMRTLRLVG